MLKYIDLYLSKVPDLINQLDKIALKQNPAELASLLHGNKSMWMMMGMVKTQELAAHLESLSSDMGWVAELSSGLETIQKLLMQSMDELETSKQRLQ